MRGLVSLLVLLLATVSVHAQTITIGSISGTVFCEGDTINVPYTATGSFGSQNSFGVQLSDDSGKFTSFQNIGTLRTMNSGNISAVIPPTLKGEGYKLRVISTDPYAESPSTATNFSIGRPPVLDWTVLGEREYGMIDQPTLIHIQPVRDAVSYLWEFGTDAAPSSSNDLLPTVTYSTPGFKNVKLTVSSTSGCSASNTFIDALYIGSCHPGIKHNYDVDSTFEIENRPNRSQYIWVVPGGRSGDVGLMYLAEPGSSLISIGSSDIVYLKAGSSLSSGLAPVIIFEEGASISVLDSSFRYKCPNLEFDYSDAPPYKINQASVSRVKGSTVQVYPNPTTDRLTIEHADNHIRELSIRNTLGAEQLFMHPEGLGKTTVDVSRLAAGLYFLDLITDRGIETHKIVVTR